VSIGRAVPKIRWAQTVDGAWIAYQDCGEGPVALVVITAWLSHLEIYWEQPRFVRFMRRMAERMRVLVFDKRGTGMSDRIIGAPDLETRMDDLRAVLDAAGVERAALFSWSVGAPQLGAMFAATYPERAVALFVDPWIVESWAPDAPYHEENDEEIVERDAARLMEIWGDDEHGLEWVKDVYGEEPGAAPFDDARFLAWNARFARFAATPGSARDYQLMWYRTGIRDVLPTIRVPAGIIVKADQEPHAETEEAAAFTARLIPGSRILTVPGVAHVPWIEDPGPIAREIERFLDSVREEEAELDRVLATVLFTDMVGSTNKAAELGDRRWKDLLKGHHSAVRAMIARYRGKEIDTAGDGFLVTFDGPARAVRCAQAICQAVKPLDLQVRAGCHTGEIELLGADVGGIAVHIGARIAALAQPSEVLVSSTVKDLVAGSGLVFSERGEHELRGVPGTWRLYAVEAQQ
jgi:class 3 adenylate cyclase/pimeloyl-ACP methyl ester carboxylesterase